MSTARIIGRLAAGTTVAGLAGVGYAAGIERNAFTLRRFELPVLPPGSAPLRLLHFSDLHLLPRQRRRLAFVAGLADLEPDLVVSTGDHIASPEAIEVLETAIEPLLSLPGAFVFGSNDYYRPVFKNPGRYLTEMAAGNTQKKDPGPPTLPVEELRSMLRRRGWLDLNNVRGTLTVDGRTIAVAGTDDPHIGRDRYDLVAGRPIAAASAAASALAIGVTHAPYRRVLDAMAADGYELLLAGHTHGGQLCVPRFGAIVTNCDLDRGRVKGVHPYAGAILHTSAGLGTSPIAPVRFACRPEASLLTLVAR